MKNINEEDIQIPNIPNTITLWHGGNLDNYNNEPISQKSGKFSYGPGLYLITKYSEAIKYSKGNRNLYMVTVEIGNSLEKSFINYNNCIKFIKNFIIKNKQNLIIPYLEKYKDTDNVPAYVLNNLIVNYDSIKPTNTKHLRQFYIDNNIDYSIVENPFGWSKAKMMVLFNMNKIKKVQKVKPKDNIVKYDLHENKQKLNENKYIVYHSTNNFFNSFDLKRTPGNIAYFTDSLDAIKNKTTGAAGYKYIIQAEITINNPAGWDEYDKLTLSQIEDRGYDGIILPDTDSTTYIVLNKKQIKKFKRLTENVNKQNPTITFLIGPPASGKSTYTNKNANNAIIISRDNIVYELIKNTNIKYNESFNDEDLQNNVNVKLNDQIQNALKSKKNIIVDMTNMSKQDRNIILSIVPDIYTKNAIIFKVDRNELIRRLNKREKETGKKIDLNVLDDMISRYEMPDKTEFDNIQIFK